MGPKGKNAKEEAPPPNLESLASIIYVVVINNIPLPDSMNSTNLLPSEAIQLPASPSDSKPSEIKFVVNISCRLDIVKDFIKKTTIQLINTKINEVAQSIKPDNTFRLEISEEDKTNEASINPADNAIKQLKEFLLKITPLSINDIVLQELQGNVVVPTIAPEILEKQAFETLKPQGTYRMGVLQEDGTVYNFEIKN